MKSTFGDKLFYAFNYAVLTLIGLSCLFPLLHIVRLVAERSPRGRVGARIRRAGRLGDIVVQGAVRQHADPARFLEQPGNHGRRNGVVDGGDDPDRIPAVARVLLRETAADARHGVHDAVRERTHTQLPGHEPIGLINSYWVLWLPALINTYQRARHADVLRRHSGRDRGGGADRRLRRMDESDAGRAPAVAAGARDDHLFNAVGFWNAFMNVLIYINETRKYNLTVLVQQMIRRDSILPG